MGHPRQRAARAEGQRKRIIRLLEQVADADAKEQCPRCGEWYSPNGIANHTSSCEGP